MQFSTTVLLAILASASNARIVNLFNGFNTTAVTVEEPNLAPLPGGRVNHCSGSSRCTNRQKFRNQCQNAYLSVENVEYTDGGAKSGVCSGNCGFFVQGKHCSATMSQMLEAYKVIREDYNCLACGWNYVPGTNNKCWIKLDFVTGC